MDAETGLLLVSVPYDLQNEVIWLSLGREPFAACVAAHLSTGDPEDLLEEFLAVFPRVPPGDYVVWVSPEGAPKPIHLSEVAMAAGSVIEINWRRS